MARDLARVGIQTTLIPDSNVFAMMSRMTKVRIRPCSHFGVSGVDSASEHAVACLVRPCSHCGVSGVDSASEHAVACLVRPCSHFGVSGVDSASFGVSGVDSASEHVVACLVRPCSHFGVSGVDSASEHAVACLVRPCSHFGVSGVDSASEHAVACLVRPCSHCGVSGVDSASEHAVACLVQCARHQAALQWYCVRAVAAVWGAVPCQGTSAGCTQVYVSAHALLANGGVMARVGTHLVALAAKRHEVPFVVLAGLHTLSPLFPHDPTISFNDFKVSGAPAASGLLVPALDNPGENFKLKARAGINRPCRLPAFEPAAMCCR